ncbi:MAG: CDP-alcohol phosphatidyltransferase family protein [Desulfobacterales bacterium]
MIQYRGRLVNQHGEALPIGLVSQASVSIEEALKDLTRVSAKGVAELINDQRSARRAERHLWSSLTSKTDGFVDRTVNRPLGRFLSKILIHAPLTPNQISVISMMIGLWAAYCFNLGNYAAGIIGALLLQVSAIIDCVDGDIARILYKESRLGKWLDISADQVVHVALFAAIAIGLKRQGSSAPVLLLGISAVIGALLSFGVVVRGMVVPKNRQNAKLQKLIDSTTNRDFSVLLLLLALFNQLDWFLWLAAIGVHIFWLTALILQLAETRHQPFESE